MQKIQGIYKIKNIINNKCYIGQSCDIESRWKKHLADLEKNIHHSEDLQEDFNKYGRENFSFEILEKINDPELLFIIEDFYINKFHTYSLGYNMTPSKQQKKNIYNLYINIDRINETLYTNDFIVFDDILLGDITSGIADINVINGMNPLLDYLLFLKKSFPLLKSEIYYENLSKNNKKVYISIEYDKEKIIIYSLNKNIKLSLRSYSASIIKSNNPIMKKLMNKKVIDIKQRIKYWE